MIVIQLAAETDVSASSVQKILKKDLSVKKLAPKFVMTALTDAQRNTRVEICRENARLIGLDGSILERLVAADESWMFTYDPRTKQVDLEWTFAGEPRPRKALRSRSQTKVMLILYFDCRGIVLADFVDNATVNSEVYVSSLRRMREALRKKCPELWQAKNFILLHDNARSHTSEETVEFLTKVNQEVWKHLPYSPDLSPCDFFAFPLLKAKIRGHRFQSLGDVKDAARREMYSWNVDQFKQCFQKLQERYLHCIAAEGHYFEGQGKRGLAAPE